MRKHLLTLLASAALAFGIAGQASARDYHDDNRGHHGNRYYSGQHHNPGPHHSQHRPQYSGYSEGSHARSYYSRNYYAPLPPRAYYDGYGYDYGDGYGVGYSEPGFGLYIAR